ncbi:MAG: pentapeptide repeat-containing protein [Pirellulales bacterium]
MATTFRDCDLTVTDFRGVVFTDCSLIDLDLRGADLRGTSFGNSLQGGQFDAKTLYDRATRFPPGFDPVAKGLTLK